MCGILGLSINNRNCDSSPLTMAQFERAAGTLTHRGPDESGLYSDDNVWLAHRRLSILDLTAAGQQPMRTADGRYVISYNGEVYNFQQLARDYGLGNLRSSSDTEVVLRLFEQLGSASFTLLNGMFAFAIYDIKDKKVWLVRDRVGIKPLYYEDSSSGIRFASEIKALLTIDERTRSCDYSALHEWLYYGNPLGSRTLYEGIRQLLPGHYLEYDLRNQEFNVHKYWSIGERSLMRGGIDNKSLIETTRQHLEASVMRQLVSDVPVGVFLSGGVDSSAIVAFASRHYEGRLTTYSVDFEFMNGKGELDRARQMSRRCGTNHNEITISGKNIAPSIEKLIRHHDAPFSDAANLPLLLMSQQVQHSTKVVLQGDGGDELFGGYRRYSTVKYVRIIHLLAQLAQRFDRSEIRSVTHQRIRRYIQAFAADDIANMMAALLTLEYRSARPEQVFSVGVRNKLEKTDPFVRFRSCIADIGDADIGNLMSFVDLMIVLPDSYLQKVDRATMAASVEVRVPFLDHELLDFVLGIPGYRKMPWGKKKWLLKQSLHGVVPHNILYAPKKGLEVPYETWLQVDLKDLFFDSIQACSRVHPNLIDVEAVSKLYLRTAQGRGSGSYMLWKMLNLSLWAKNAPISFES